MPAVVFDVWFGAEHVGDLLLGPRCDRLVHLEFRDAGLIGTRDVLV
jgi:hypothetical protein